MAGSRAGHCARLLARRLVHPVLGRAGENSSGEIGRHLAARPYADGIRAFTQARRAGNCWKITAAMMAPATTASASREISGRFGR